MSNGFSPWQSSLWATLDLSRPRCLNPFPGAAGACSCHCESKDGCVRWHRSSAAPTLRPQFPGTRTDSVWSSWAWWKRGEKTNPAYTSCTLEFKILLFSFVGHHIHWWYWQVISLNIGLFIFLGTSSYVTFIFRTLHTNSKTLSGWIWCTVTFV